MAFHCTDWLSSPKEVIFMKKIHQICWFSGYNLHLPVKKSAEIYAFRKKSGDFLKNLHLFCVPKLLKNTPPRGGARQWFSGKNPPDLLVFWLWFSPPKQKIFSRFCILKKILGNFEDFVFFCLSFKLKRWQSHELTNQGYWIALELSLIHIWRCRRRG